MTSKVEFKDKSGNWKILEKAGQQIPSDSELRLVGEIDNDVGRGAKKLRGSIDYWSSLKNKIAGSACLDIGSSTGGFTQVLLECGASSVVCVDVGTHQLHEKIRNDKRVKTFEQQHVLKIDRDFWNSNNVELPFKCIVTDLSFISVTKVLEHAVDWLQDGGDWLILVKPQFELDPSKTPNGIVTAEEDRKEALEKVIRSVENIKGLKVKDSMDCPLPGSKGNREYFLWVEKHLV